LTRRSIADKIVNAIDKGEHAPRAGGVKGGIAAERKLGHP
jgi:hypothetical protein